MMEERERSPMEEREQEQEGTDDELSMPDQAVEDLEPSEEEARDVSAGFKQGWISK